MKKSIFQNIDIKKYFENFSLINLFFFIFGLILTVSSIFLKEDEVLKEKSGIIGYYLFFILYELFGLGTFFIGPIYIVASLKSYFSENIRFIQNAFLGSIFFLFSFSFLLAYFGNSSCGFLGNQFFIWSSELFGSISSFIIFVIIFSLSVLKMFSYEIQQIRFLQEEKKSFHFESLLGIILFLINYKKIFKFFRSKFIINTDTIKRNMKFPKKIFGSKTKPPWIQKIEIKETQKESEKEIKDFKIYEEKKESHKDLNQEENDFNPFLDLHEKQNTHNHSIHYEEIFLENTEEALSISYDPSRNRFLFNNNESLKKKIEWEKLKHSSILEDLVLEPSLTKFIQTKSENLHSSELLEKENLSNSFLTEEVLDETISEKFKESNIEESNFDQYEKLEPDINEEIESFSDLLQENDRMNSLNKQKEIFIPQNKEIISYHLNSESYLKKLNELQEQIISSERVVSYRLSTNSIKFGENSSISSFVIQQEIQENWQKLEKVLNDFSIKAQVVGATRGPMITMFEVLLEPGVRVNRILSLQDEIRMNLATISIRIVAPIPGKTTIGIEVPNKNREFISLGDILQKDLEFFSKKRDINIPLGKDVSGITRYIDLTKLPHLLIAGATGAGKSVFLNSIIASLLFQYSPEKIRFLMIDPKMVELKLYEGIPHLLYPVIVDTKLAEKALQWAVNEMENRYKLFSLTKCRDIRSYNEKIQNKQIVGSPIPYIVIFIDELADLMMISPKEVEESVIRLTQKARAVGIHLVLATQRPSVDVITALIKANCPARVSFQVAQKVDSRIILDTNGAETLLGKGDMLYKSPSSTLPIRIQSPNITEEEIEAIVKETQKYGFFGYIELPQEEEVQLEFGFSEVDEDLIEKAWKIILETGKTSTSYIQRRLRIGYNRAANIIEKLEELGYLSPATNNKPREILRRDRL